MFRSLALAVAALAALPGAGLAAPRPSNPAPLEAVQDPDRVDPRAAVRNVERGRPGRRVGVRTEGDRIVVVWEYPGGRIADIVVDGRTGRILGER